MFKIDVFLVLNISLYAYSDFISDKGLFTICLKAKEELFKKEVVSDKKNSICPENELLDWFLLEWILDLRKPDTSVVVDTLKTKAIEVFLKLI